MPFQLVSPFNPSPGQEEAIANLAKGFSHDSKQTLLGITGSGKTFVMANIIEKLQKPTLIIAHNKTLAAQLYTELREFFPKNKVEYFISYYDYYQPESYIPTTDTYIEKDASINEQIERMRLHAVASLVSRNDTIIVASISCIYGLGNPEDFKEVSLSLKVGAALQRQRMLQSLVEMQYERNDAILEPGRFRVRGSTVDSIPLYEKDIIRVEIESDKIKSIKIVDALTGDSKESLQEIQLFPSRQFVVPKEKQQKALEAIRQELKEQLPHLPPLEAQRLKQRVNYDLEMIEEMGYCSGIENYSRHFDGRKPGEPPYVLIDYFPKDFLLIIDESHQSIPQARAMYNGDYARKKNLVEFGFRLPCAFDNRPLKFAEFEKKMPTTLFVSATPAEYELKASSQNVQLITRPTGLLDPEIEVHPIKGQMQHLIGEAQKAISKGERVLITTLTKKMAEDLTNYLAREGLRVRYMHSDIESLQRIELVRQLRAGEFDVLVGINLLREGLDIPEVSTIGILDADKEGFLRNERSLIQTIGRAARNVNGKVILYADVMTDSIRQAIKITQYRRVYQMAYNKKHHIEPRTIVKKIEDKRFALKGVKHLPRADMEKQLIELDAQMHQCAERLEFEKAIELRDRIGELKKALGGEV